MTTNIYDMTDTWSAIGTTFYAIKMNVTNTASAVGSKLLDLQVSGSSRFSVEPQGEARVTATTDPNGAVFDLYYNKASPAANDRIGEFHFYANDSTSVITQYAAIYAESPVVTNGSECGRLLMNVAETGGTIKEIFDYNGNTGIFTQSSSASYDFRIALTSRVVIDNTLGLQSQATTAATPNATANVRLGLAAGTGQPMIALNHGASYSWALDAYAGDLRLIKNAASVPFTFTQAGPAVFSVDLTLTPSASVTPTNNGELVIQATSNTSLTFKYKGSDGTVRSASLTLV